MSIPVIMVTGHLLQPTDDNVGSGRVVFQLTEPIRDPAGEVIADLVPAIVDLVAGAFSIGLVANDAPGTLPVTGTQYRVTRRVEGVEPWPEIYVTVPYNAPGGTIDLSQLYQSTTPFAPTPDTLVNVPAPQDQGLISWSFDSALANAAVQPTSGVLTLARLPVRRATIVQSLLLRVVSGGLSLSSGHNFVGIYNQAGTRLAASADQTTAWGSAGVKVASVTAASVQPPWVWLAVLANGLSTPVMHGGSTVVGAGNAGTLTTAKRFAAVGSGLTALPTSFNPASLVDATSLWGAAA